jgi:hypothetical protein
MTTSLNFPILTRFSESFGDDGYYLATLPLPSGGVPLSIDIIRDKNKYNKRDNPAGLAED